MPLRIAVIGATGIVGREMIRQLSQSSLSNSELVPFASSASVGQMINGHGPVQSLSAENIVGFDIALFSAGADISRAWAPLFVQAGTVVVDNSSAWRDDPNVPLVVVGVNDEDISLHQGIIANPNCTTMIMSFPLHTLHELFSLVTVNATSFQAASGAGQQGVDELLVQEQHIRGSALLYEDGQQALQEMSSTVHAAPLAYNVVPLIGTVTSNGYTDEELKMQTESQRILHLEQLQVNPHCHRVPVMVGHGISVDATFQQPVNLIVATAALAANPHIQLMEVPTPLLTAGNNGVIIGRIHRHLHDAHTLHFFVAGDNILQGAASNAVAIAEQIVTQQ